MDEIGRRRSEVYDDYKDAEYALLARKMEVEQIRRGLRVRPPESRTFDELANGWLETRTPKKRTRKDDESITRVHLLPAFSELKISDVTAERIAVFQADLIASKAPQTARNILVLLGGMLRQAVEWGWIEKEPKIRLPRVRYFSGDYRWLKTTEEREHFLLAAKAHHWPVVFPMYATAIYTGMRAGELAGLSWEDISFERRLITVQRSYGGLTKSGEVRRVPILDELLPILKEWKLASGSKRLAFPNNKGRMWDQSGRIFQEVLHSVLQRGGFPLKYITFHSLRHTFASHWVMNGGDPYALQEILGHKDSKMTKRYAHLRPDAYQKYWGIMGPAKCREDKIVEMHKEEA